ncbi:MAG: aminopeptidase P family protein [Magnetovibrionaceae bacterium]
MDHQPEKSTLSEARLDALRAGLKALDLDGFIIPKSDENLGEYVPPRAERLAWLTGFTGSAGMAVVLRDKAAVFSDGRYTLQMASEVDSRLFDCCHITQHPVSTWLKDHLAGRSGGRIGYDPWLHAQAAIERMAGTIAEWGGKLVPVENNPVDQIWPDQPAAPGDPVRLQDISFAGKTSITKRDAMAVELVGSGDQALVLTAADSIAWLLNIRGSDVPFTPFALGFAVLDDQGKVGLFMAPEKLSVEVRDALGADVTCQPREAFGTELDTLSGKRVRFDPTATPAWIVQRLTAAGAKLHPGTDPCMLAKAIKNDVEIEGTRAAHLRDGVALTRFLCWLDAQKPGEDLRELAVSDRLEAFRAEGEHFRGLSFPTISGAGPNGAIVHYRVTPETDAALLPGSLFLVDSGGQYLDGTTDVTRTVAIGEPTDEMRRRFTQVLKGHIAVAGARFPKGTNGSQLDVLARHALWMDGVDYDHGTGHGVGSYLSVHEGPQRISKAGGGQALVPGMILSNEPGYYKTDAFGIRIENLVLVREDSRDGDERVFYAFETLTLAPIDRRLIQADGLSPTERDWVDSYHIQVRQALSDHLDPESRAWLKAATRPIAQP